MTADDPWDTNNRDKSSRKKDLMMKSRLCAPVTFEMKNKDAVAVGPCCICLCDSLHGQMASKVVCWGLAEFYKPSLPFKKLTVTHPHQPHQWLQNSTEVIFKWHDPCFYFINLICKKKKKFTQNNEDYFTVRYSKADQDQGSHLQHPVILVYSPTPLHHLLCDSKVTILNSSFQSHSIVHHCWTEAATLQKIYMLETCRLHCSLWSLNYSHLQQQCVYRLMIHLAHPKPQNNMPCCDPLEITFMMSDNHVVGLLKHSQFGNLILPIINTWSRLWTWFQDQNYLVKFRKRSWSWLKIVIFTSSNIA